MYTPFAYAFAYAIKQIPYAFVAKIILCMYLLYGRALEKHSQTEQPAHDLQIVGKPIRFFVVYSIAP